MSGGCVNESVGRNWKLNIKEMEPAARSLGVQLQVHEMRGPDDLDRAFQTAKRQRAEAFLLAASGILALSRKRIIELVSQSRLPAIGSNVTWAEEGCLLSYGPGTAESFRRAAVYVDKILKGAKPAELPVEQPMKFELVVNLKTAKQIGFIVPPNVLARADKVIR